MHIHILGICGTFMGGLAALARECGHTVTGCDRGVYPPMSDQLRALGIELIEGYDPGQLSIRPDLFVVGNVVTRGNPLMEAILDAGLPYTSGPQWLAEQVLRGRHVLAVAGTHGKTTTTAMLAWILEDAGRSPGFLVGGVPENFGVSARLGGSVGGSLGGPLDSSLGGSLSGSLAGSAGSPKGGSAVEPLFVIEADEYDTAFFDKRSKFVHYRPRTVILNNLEHDHADIFPDLGAIETQFHHLVRTVPASGTLVVNAREAALQRVLARGCWSGVQRFGVTREEAGAWRARGELEAFDVLRGSMRVARVEWDLGGEHNQLNALAALAAAQAVGVEPTRGAQALSRFRNVKRRMELRGEVRRGEGLVRVHDDFAHHPTAIRTTVDGLRRQLDRRATPGRVLAIFEPRSNTMKLGTMKAQLPWALEGADLAFCHSGGIDWDAAAALAPMGKRASVHASIDELVRAVVAAVRPGDELLCMSNGGFGGVHEKLLRALAPPQ